MCQQDVESYQDKDDATQQFRFETPPDAFAEENAKGMADDGKDKRNDKNDNKRKKDAFYRFIRTHTGKGDSHRQCVDTGCHGEEKLGAKVAWVEMLLLHGKK